jgi:carboxymethylenebutenolidase
VIVIQEWWGLVGHIKDVADRFAGAGWRASRGSLPRMKTDEPDEAGKLMGLAMDQAAKDIAGAAAYLASRSDVRPARWARWVTVWGSLALGRRRCRITSWPRWPLPGRAVGRMSPIWSNYAGKAAVIHCSEGDGTSAAPGIQQAVTAIQAAGGEVTTYDYPSTEHAFVNSDRPEVYVEKAAESAWSRTLDFFATRLG